ncbi:MAG: N-acetylneuraminate synthase family protein [Patescibacteria group bacterium]|nr:N-acetylneuraminate synthase family protein [Patescibacteria group bacterium]
MNDRTLNINGRLIGEGHPTFVVAEIGLNHNGNLSLAKKMIKLAKDSGADAVKFQKRDLKAIYKEDVYNDPNQDSQSTVYLFSIFKKYELDKSEYIELKKYCDEIGIIFFATPFDLESVEFLESLQVPLYKIASGDLTNIPLIHRIIKTKKPIILSTGMSNPSEIDYTVKFLNKNKAKFALMHCVSTYPANFKDVNLKMINVLKETYKVPVGYSGHERGITVAVCAVALGANIIEKHFTLDRSMDGPDHNLSIMPEGLKKMVDRIRVAEVAIGNGIRTIARGEILTREVFGKSLVAAVPIKAGEVITHRMIDVKSPGKGLSPQLIDKLIGKKTKRNIAKNDYFIHSDVQ